MSLAARFLLTATSAAVLAVCGATAPAFAAAHPSHHTAVTHTGAHHPSKPAHDKLAGPRRGASHAVAAQLKAVDALSTRAAHRTLADGPALSAALTADAAAIRADLTAVGTAPNVKSLRALVSAAGTSRQLAQTQYSVVSAADADATTATILSATVSDLGAQLAALTTAGTDTTAGQAHLAEAKSELATASTEAAAAVSSILAVIPNASRAQEHAGAATAHAELVSISVALSMARADIASVQAQYGL
jgi:hypothetical protein